MQLSEIKSILNENLVDVDTVMNSSIGVDAAKNNNSFTINESIDLYLIPNSQLVITNSFLALGVKGNSIFSMKLKDINTFEVFL